MPTQKGAAPVLVILAILGILIFIFISSTFDFKNKLFSRLFPKPPSHAAAATIYSPKILLLIYNPVLESYSNQTLVTYKRWNSPDQLTQDLITTFASVSGQLVNYTIAQRVEIDGIPVLVDGFQYTDSSYLDCLNSAGSNCHNPQGANYVAMINTVDACGKRNRGEIDELWIWGGPWFGYWESNLTGPGAFWYNSSPTTGTTCEKVLPIMGFNYERGLQEALESYGHRAESTMVKVYGSWEAKDTHSWNKFTQLDVNLPGKGGCGNAHLAFNAASNTGYDRENTRIAPSSCEDFLNYPNLTGIYKDTNCIAWGCNTLGYFKWWYSHMPKAAGFGPDGKLNSWWGYFVDPQNTIVSPPPTPTPTPISNSSDTTPPAISITNPTNGAILKAPSKINIQASASDNLAISKVEISVNGSVKCTFAINQASYSCPWSVPGKNNTQYTVTAKAYDTSNNSQSASVNVTAK